MHDPELGQRIQGLSDTKKQLLVRALEENDLDASWLFQELPVPPRNPQEALLAEIWEDVLSLADVGVEDNFFDLGGDSILSVRIVAKARERGLVFSSRQLFECPTIASLMEVAEIADPSLQPAAQGDAPSGGPSEAKSASLSPEAFPEAELSEDELGQVLELLSQRRADSDGRLRFAADDASSVETAGELPRLLALRSARF